MIEMLLAADGITKSRLKRKWIKKWKGNKGQICARTKGKMR